MELDRDEIIARLLQIDSDMSLLDTTDDIYDCVIVGGGALVLMRKIFRSTRDIDAISASDEIKPLLDNYNMNMNVKAYMTYFAEDYDKRVVKVDIPTSKVNFYTISLEDLVVSKLCSMREKDMEDIESETVYKELDWEIMDKLVKEVCYGMINDYEVNLLKIKYEHYKERFKWDD